jgi:hypothetical protein
MAFTRMILIAHRFFKSEVILVKLTPMGVGAHPSRHSIAITELNLVEEEKIAVPRAMDFEENIAGTAHPLKFGVEEFCHRKIGLSGEPARPVIRGEANQAFTTDIGFFGHSYSDKLLAMVCNQRRKLPISSRVCDHAS